ncbi:hypothetical protein ACLRAN_10560, partial [[Pasteurella] aerogenes]
MAYGLQFGNKIYTGNEPSFKLNTMSNVTLEQSHFPIELFSSNITFDSNTKRFKFTGNYLQYNIPSAQTKYGVVVNSKNLLSELKIVKRETITFKTNEFRGSVLEKESSTNQLVLYKFVSIDSQNFTVERVFLEIGGVYSTYGALNNSTYLSDHNLSYTVSEKTFKQIGGG